QPGSTFNLNSLASAAILGPGDGSDPVGISMGGTARIAAAVTPLNGVIAGETTAPQTILIDRPAEPVPSNLIAPGQNFPTEPQTVQLTNNSGSDLNEFFIDSEPSLILNGFDLGAIGVTTPAEISALGIAITQPVPGVPIDVLIYEDSNGGSPVDSVLVGRNQVFINSAGTLRVPFPEPVRVNSSIIWVGFYLPVGTRFVGDSSGSSVLTWWAWQPQGTFDVTSLSNAGVLGPADGSDPVGIDMGGIARINVEITPVDFIPENNELTQQNFPIGIQIIDDTGANLSTLRGYDFCGDLSYDSADFVSAGGSFTIECRSDVFQNAAGTFINLDDTPSGIVSFERVGFLYDLKAYGDYQREGSTFATELKTPITHCIRPQQVHLEAAVIGLRFSQPGNWKILPTVRFGELICAELEHEGLITYFIPRDGSEGTINADVEFSGPMRLIGPPVCNRSIQVEWSIHNAGFVTTPPTTIAIRDALVSTGAISIGIEIPQPALAPDETFSSSQLFFLPDTNLGELHRIEVVFDPNNRIPELNEDNNIISLEYILQGKSEGC
ncbi:MAG: CARDB domain-containing protein, partial [Aggregatilineales bacterium]